MFASVERSTAPICSNALFDAMQISSHAHNVGGRDITCAGSPFFTIARGVVRSTRLPVASIAADMNLSAARIRNRVPRGDSTMSELAIDESRFWAIVHPAESDLI
jgi:hypothetical protein